MKTRDNYDKESSSANQLFEFVFGKNFLKNLLAKQKNPENEKGKKCKYPNQLFLSVNCEKEIMLDVSA